jgi:hypothetical protein
VSETHEGSCCETWLRYHFDFDRPNPLTSDQRSKDTGFPVCAHARSRPEAAVEL